MVFRGQVYKCYFGENIGSEECKERPCVIILGNFNSPNTIVAPITNSPGEPKTTVPIDTKYDGEDIVLSGHVLLGNIVTVSKARLSDFIVSLTTGEMKQVDEKIMVSLGIIGQYKTLRDKLTRDKQHIRRITDDNYKMRGYLEAIKKDIGVDSYEAILDKCRKK